MADFLKERVHISCLVLTTAENHYSKAAAVKMTWGKRCDSLIFASDVDDALIGAVKGSASSRYQDVWQKTRFIFQRAFNEQRYKYHWFLKADDDSYVIIENLRLVLGQYSFEEPLMVGRHLEHFLPGGGYAINRAALIKLGEKAFKDPSLCAKPSTAGPEDILMMECLKNVGVKVADSRDEFGRQRFFSIPLEQMISGDFLNIKKSLATGRIINELTPGDVHKTFYGEIGISDTAAIFHHMTPEAMKTLHCKFGLFCLWFQPFLFLMVFSSRHLSYETFWCPI